MNATIPLGHIDMPRKAATRTFSILAKRGAGKSYAGGVLAEGFAAAGIPFVVIDPIDVWWGLRLDADGKRPGLPVVVFGERHADIPLTAEMGAAIAQAVAHHNISCVISTFGMSKRGQRRLVTDFAEELLRINETPRHIFVEEAQEFVPQALSGEVGAVYNAVSRLVVLGRNRGIGVTLIGQRPAAINKEVLTQTDTLIALRMTGPQDRDAIRQWVINQGEEGDIPAFLASLPTLPTGEGWLWSPEFLERFERVKIQPRQTFHPDNEKIGPKFVMPTLAQADIKDFIAQFSNGSAPVTEIKQEPAKPKDATTILQNWGEARRMGNEIATKLREPAKDAAEEGERAEEIANYERRLQAKEVETYELRQTIAEQKREIEALNRRLEAIREIVGGGDPDQEAEEGGQLHLPAENPVSTSLNQKLLNVWFKKLGGQKNGSARILSFLAEMYPKTFTRRQVALSIGMTASGGSYQRYVSELLKNKMIAEEKGYLRLSNDLIEVAVTNSVLTG